jgi:hypothetical protein
MGLREDRPTRSAALPPHGAFKVIYFYAALCIYLAALTAFLGWWARFPR